MLDKVTIKAYRPTYARLLRVKDEMKAVKGRPVTMSEMLDELVRHYDVTAQQARDATEAGR